jgi:hypothetical protein
MVHVMNAERRKFVGAALAAGLAGVLGANWAVSAAAAED